MDSSCFGSSLDESCGRARLSNGLAEGNVNFFSDGLFACITIAIVEGWFEVSSFIKKVDEVSWELMCCEIVNLVG